MQKKSPKVSLRFATCGSSGITLNDFDDVNKKMKTHREL